MRMKTKLMILSLGMALLAGLPAKAADDTNAPPVKTNEVVTATTPASTDFTFYRLITERNIFDPNRTVRGPRTNNTPAPPPLRVDWFVLRGTSTYETNAYAFFDGTSSLYRGQFKLTDTIAGYRILEINTESVSLGATEDKKIELKVGMQMKRTEGKPWTLVVNPDLIAGSTGDSSDSGSSSGSSTGSSSSTGGGAGGDVSEIMKRMMERRAKEGGQ